jgi:autotransporter-associated beta strand protein
MKVRSGILTAAVSAAAAAAVFAPVASATIVTQDFFDYTAGARLIGQTNPGSSKLWGDPPTPTQPIAGVDTQLITAGNLSFPGLAAPTGNSVIIPNDINSNIARIDFPAEQSVNTTTNGLFFSFAMKLTSFTPLPAGTGTGQAGSSAAQNGAFVAGYNWGSNAGPPAGGNGMQSGGAYGAMFRIRREVDANNADTGKYQLGIIKNNGAGASTIYAWDTSRSYSVGETLLITASYKFVGAYSGAGSTDDQSFLWVNGVPGDLQPVSPTVTAPSGPGAGDMYATNSYRAQSFYFRSDANQPGNMLVDELRIGHTFEEVTPSAPKHYWDTDGVTPGAGGTAPAGTWDGATTNFNSDSTGGGAGTLSAAPTANDIVNFAAGTGATGTYTVNVTGSQSAGVANFTQGDVTLDGGSLAVGKFHVAAGASGAVTSVVSGFGVGSGAGSVTKTGPGTLTLSGANTHTGGTFVYEGTLVAANADALAGGFLSASTGTTARLQAGLPKAATVTKLDVVGTGVVDLTDNSMVIKNMTVAQVQAMIKKSFNAGQWNATGGLTSSTAAAASPAVTAIGFASNGILNKSDFKGVGGLDADDVLVKYTYYGDSDLNGATTLDDYTLFLNGYQTAGTTWVQGDYDYNGLVTLDDFTLFLAGYQQQGAPLSELESLINGTPMNSADRSAMLAAVQAVPEPAGLALLGAAGAGLLGRRRRRRGA